MSGVTPVNPTPPGVATAWSTQTAEALRHDPLVNAARTALDGHTVWHVNTTAVGGGIAELLRSAVPWHNRVGLRTRWLVTSGDTDFFTVTKQLHHLFHGSPGTGAPLTGADAEVYARVTTEAARSALTHMSAGDVVVLHDPQVLGMAPLLVDAGLRVAWRSHIGTAAWSDPVAEAWGFLARYLPAPHRYAFSSADYVPPAVDRSLTRVIHPTIDPGSAKCRPLTGTEIEAFTSAIGLTTGSGAALPGTAASYAADRVRVFQDTPLPPDAPTVLQISRWDPLKDMSGVLTGFVEHIADASPDAHLVLAGPDPDDIPDDPENRTVFDAVRAEHRRLPTALRRRVHLVVLGLADDDTEMEANALVVNALQRRATVVCQKSLQEGFGLAVTEAMWKERPVVASAVGGIREQVVPGVHGLLLEEPSDLAAFGSAVTSLLNHRALRDQLTGAARQHCRERFLVDRELRDYARLYTELTGAGPAASPGP